ncbi:immunity repressor [Gordonia phage Squiddly]|nr:immunity repressor [Gordonia phage Squiddly]
MSEPTQPPEGELLERLRTDKHPKLSVREAARRAGISGSRWTQIERGYKQETKDVRVPARAPADTLARMARVVGASADQLREAGRDDAADELQASLGRGLAKLIPTAAPTPPTDHRSYEEAAELEYITNTVQMAVSMLERRKLWLAIQLINQASKDLSDYLEPTKESQDDISTKSTTEGSAGQADTDQKNHAGDARDEEDNVKPLTPWNQVPEPERPEDAKAARKRNPRFKPQDPDESH